MLLCALDELYNRVAIFRQEDVVSKERQATSPAPNRGSVSNLQEYHPVNIILYDQAQ
jgi:hypothetical protein